MPHRPAGWLPRMLRKRFAQEQQTINAEKAVRAAKKTMAGEWRFRVRNLIMTVRQDIEEKTRERRTFTDILRHTKPHSAQDGTLRDMMRGLDADLANAQVRLRTLRGLLKLTKRCPRCKGRGQKFDRRKKRWGRDVMRPCSLCRAQGALWVHP